MGALRARVVNGRLVLDQPTTLPDGTTIDLVVDDEGDDLDDAERRVLNDAIARAWGSAKAGNVRPGADVVRDLRDRE